MGDLASRCIDRQIAVFEDRDRLAGATTHDGAQPCKQLVEVKRFAKIIVGTGVESLDAIGDRLPRSHHDNRQGIAHSAQFGKDLQSVAIGQA